MVNDHVMTEDEIERMIAWIEQARELLERSNDVIEKWILCKPNNHEVGTAPFIVWQDVDDYLKNVWRTD
jgi:hypothetical protein